MCSDKGTDILKHCALMLVVGLLWGCGPNGAEAPATLEMPVPPPPIALILTDGDDGPWTLDVALDEPGLVFFSRSNGDYRTETYAPQGQSGRVQRIGGYDTLILEDGVRHARFEITPYSDNIRADYTPFIPFSDGGVALFTGQFELLTATDRTSIEALEGRLSNWTGEQRPISLTLRSDRPMLIDSSRVSGDSVVMVDGGGEYVYFGNAELVDGENFVGVVDPGLPDWIREDFDDTLGIIFTALEERYGYGLQDRATILFAYRGDAVQGFRNKGGALPGNVLALETEGTALLNPSDRIIRYFQFFFAHEAAHLFQQASGKTLGSQESAWIHEGQASAIAYRLLVEQGIQTQTNYEIRLAEAYNRCAKELEGRTLAETLFTGRIGAYDCGEVIAVASDAALPNYDLFDLFAKMVAIGDDPERYEAKDYFKALEELGADKDVVTELRVLTSNSLSDADAVLRRLLDAADLKTTLIDGEVTQIAMAE